LKYRAEIDGLRALAVVPVILFHAGFESFSGGFVGVDIFFVISGYLITTILIEDIEKKRFSLVNFYERRARRILPALAVVSLFSIICAWVLLNPIELNKFGFSLLGVATFTSNIVFWRSEGYFTDSAELNPLLHTWSLAVEEQYYVLFPIFMFFAWRFGKSKVFWMIVLFSLLSLALSEWGWRNKPTANFYLAPTRAWELFAGSIAAFSVQKRGVKVNNYFSILGLIAIIFSIFAYDESTPFPSVYALVPVLGVVLLILYGAKETYAAQILGSRAFVSIGLISYSAYLWHQPVLVYTRITIGNIELGLGLALLLILVTFILAYLSWRYVENPFRKREIFSPKSVFSLSAVSLIFLLSFGLLSSEVSKNVEEQLALDLSTSEFVYFSNIDERSFVSSRLNLPLNNVETLVMGSSRMMQVGTATLNESVLNLSVSSASIEDNVAFVGEAVMQVSPNRVLIGADPWLLNRFNAKDRWKSVASLYEHWAKLIAKKESNTLNSKAFFSPSERDLPGKRSDFSFFKKAYNAINFNSGSLVARGGDVEGIAKKAYDGFHIYNDEYQSTTQNEMKKGFDNLLKYNMQDFEIDVKAKTNLTNLVSWLKRSGVEVYFVFSPYHPNLYSKMLSNNSVHIEIERYLKDIASDLGVNIVGSYNPKVNGCMSADFYDGMHPQELCMKKVLNGISR